MIPAMMKANERAASFVNPVFSFFRLEKYRNAATRPKTMRDMVI